MVGEQSSRRVGKRFQGNSFKIKDKYLLQPSKELTAKIGISFKKKKIILYSLASNTKYKGG